MSESEPATMLCVPIMVQGLEQALSQCVQAAEQGADLVEFRIDSFTSEPDGVRLLVERAVLPCIVTCRLASEGGEYDGDEQTRISVLEHACLGARQPAYLDVELAAYQSSANLRQKIHLVVDNPDHRDRSRRVTTGLILSSHDFIQRPADLDRKVLAMASTPAARVIKVAWLARSLRDNVQAFELIEQRYKPTVALCMGEAGLASRVLARKFGALLTFASLSRERETAPGQPTVDELKKLYRWDAVTRSTRVYGVIGDPVGHSLSPHIHNAGFDATGYDGVYLPMPIPPAYEHFKATVGEWLAHKPLDFRGASVTIPHKANLLRFVQENKGEIEPLALRIGVANTLAVRDDGSLYACNTDYAAALDSVCDRMGVGREQLKNVKVAVLGAGGAARAIVAGFADQGARVQIYNRTVERAQQLADDFGDLSEITAHPLDAAADSDANILINCTSIGMHPHVDASPLPAAMPAFLPGAGAALPGAGVVFDTIYNPRKTLLLKQAERAGCMTIAGTEMFVRQGARQFALWTQQPAPLDVFREVLDRRLGEAGV